MSAAQEYFERKSGNALRAGGTYAPAGLQSPHTPQRGIASTLSSPGGMYRAEEDHVILQVGSRSIQAGFAGDSKPRCIVTFGGLKSCRVGDYRPWIPGYEEASHFECPASNWGRDHELWRMDTRGLDLMLVQSKLERALREIYTKYLLLDSKSRRVVLALPSLLPHSLINVLLSTLFNNFQVPTVSVLSLPLLSILAAGQRSGMVIDIGWQETLMTSVYEFRETQQTTTVRALRNLTLAMGKLLEQTYSAQIDLGQDSSRDILVDSWVADDERMAFSFNFTEDVVTRLAWCSSIRNGSVPLQSPGQDEKATDSISFDVLGPSHDSQCLKLSSREVDRLVESVLILHPTKEREQDDEQHSIPFLLYKSLLNLAPDVRALCLSNIIFTGGGADIPGIKSRIMNELSRLIDDYGWDKVARTKSSRSADLGSKEMKRAQDAAISDAAQDQSLPTAEGHATKHESVATEEETDGESKGQSEPNGNTDTQAKQIHSVGTLGPWAGASLAANMKMRGIVEIERDTFLQSGMAGSRNVRDVDIIAIKSRHSLAAGIPRASGNEGSWTLGTWA